MSRVARFVDPSSPSFVALGQFAASALALISAPIVARAIGPDGRGETAAVLAVTYMWPLICGMGLPLEVRRHAAATNETSVLRTARVWVVLLFLPSVLVGAILSFTLFDGFPPAEKVAALVAVSMAPLAVSWMCDQSILISRSQYGRVAVVQIMQPAVYVLLIATGWVSGIVSVAFVIWSNAAAVGATFIAAAALARVGFGGPRLPLKSTLRRSIPFAGSSITDATTNRLDQLLALPIMGGPAAGFYAVAATVGALAMPLGHALAASSFNAVARTPAGEREKIIGDRTREALALGIISSVVVIILAPFGIPLLFGTDFSQAVIPTMICAAGACATIAAYVCMLSFAGSARGKEMTLAQIVRLITATILLIWLGTQFGAIGASIASAVGSWVLLAMLLSRLKGGFRMALVRPADIMSGLRRLQK